MEKFGRVLLFCIIAFAFTSTAYGQMKQVSNVHYKMEDKKGQVREGSVFSPIEKYVRKGDVACLSAWFADNLQISMFGKVSNCSKSQACRILKNFFAENSPKEFRIVYKSGSYPMQCAMGEFTGGGFNYSITIMSRLMKMGPLSSRLKSTENS